MSDNSLDRLKNMFGDIGSAAKNYTSKIVPVPEPEPISNAEEKRRIMLSIIKSADCEPGIHNITVSGANMNEPFVQYYNGSHSDNNGYDGDSCGKEGGFHYGDESAKPMKRGSRFSWGAKSMLGEQFVFYSYDMIPKAKLPNLFKFDKDFRFEELVALYDISSDCSNGIAFMLSGMYIPSSFGGKYISYSDINDLGHDLSYATFQTTSIPFPVIRTKDGNSYKLPANWFGHSYTNELIEELVLVDRAFKTTRYKSGKTERAKSKEDYFFGGEKLGYVRASAEYEKKLRDQAKKFLEKENEWKKERDEYEALLDDCAKTIDELEAKIANGGGFEYQNRRDSVMYLYNDLKNLRSA